MRPPRPSPALLQRDKKGEVTSTFDRSFHIRSVTRDCRARERGHRLRFDSAPLDAGPGATDPCGGRWRHLARRRRIEAETAPPPPRTAVSGHAPVCCPRGSFTARALGRDDHLAVALPRAERLERGGPLLGGGGPV